MSGRAASASPRLRERAAEREAITAAARAAAAGQGTCVVLTGAAGIGKTALLDAAVREDLDRFTICRARGAVAESQQPFGTVISLLAEQVFDLPEGGLRGAAALALPLFHDGEVDGGGGAFARRHGLHWLTVSLSDQRPLALVVDDVQWADPASLRFLTYLADRLAGQRILLLLAARTGEAAGPDLSELLAGADRTLAPEALSVAGVQQMVEDELGADGPQATELAARVAERTGGNPLYVRETLRHIDPADPGTESVTPASIIDAVHRRLAQVGGTANEIAAAVAVLGEAASVGEIAALAGCEGRETTRTLDALVSADLLDENDPRRFRHPLLRDAVAEGVPFGRRLDLEASAAALLAHGHPIRSAEHLLASTHLAPLNETWVVPTLQRAADLSAKRGVPSRAATYLERALVEGLDPATECQVRLRLGSLLDEARDVDALEHLARAWELVNAHGWDADDVEATAVATAYADGLFHFAMLAESGEVCRSAQAALPREDREQRLVLEAAALNAETLTSINRDRPALLREDVVDAESPAARAVLAHVAFDASVRGSEPHSQVRELAERAISGEQLLDEVGPASPVYVYAGTALSWAGAYPQAAEYATAGIDRAVDTGSLVGLAYATSLRAGNAIYAGDITQAETDTQRVLDELADADPMCFAITVGWQIEVDIEHETPERAVSLLTDFGLDGDLPDIGTIDRLLIARARLRIEVGDHDRALEDLAEVARRGERSHYDNPVASPWRSMTALLHLRREDSARPTRELAHTELEMAASYGAPRAVGVAHLALAQVEPEASLDHLRSAVEVLSGSGASLAHAEGLVELGAHEGAGSQAERRRLLAEGMDLAHRCGSGRVVTRAMTALRSTGARPRRPRLSGLHALTPRERRVAALAAEGSSNQEIAEALFLTRRTVELHLTNSYRKLGISSRSDLAATLVR
ncbi:AAA family ATPase [Nocardioides sp.]|uniref:ATP-binding protein n=1 Tax=Nocardioides sp. TaxID=35761 RepID=UPI00356832EF